MSLEEDIKQTKPFRSERSRALVNILYTAHTLSERFDQFFIQHGITQKQFNLLRILRGADARSVNSSYIKERLLSRNSDVSRLIDRVVAKGWAIKIKDPEDARLIRIRISDDGLIFLARMDPYMSHMEELLQHMEITECEILNNLLDRCRGSRDAD